MMDKPQTRTELYVAIAMLLMPELRGYLDDASTQDIIDTIRRAHGSEWGYIAGAIYIAGRAALKIVDRWRQ